MLILANHIGDIDVLREAVAAFPDLPVTVAPIVADLDPAWFGSEQAQALAREFFDLPQVEIGTHTWSHPFDWNFFADGDVTKEVPLLRKYPRRPGGNDDDAWTPIVRQAAAKREQAVSERCGLIVRICEHGEDSSSVDCECHVDYSNKKAPMRSGRYDAVKHGSIVAQQVSVNP